MRCDALLLSAKGSLPPSYCLCRVDPPCRMRPCPLSGGGRSATDPRASQSQFAAMVEHARRGGRRWSACCRCCCRCLLLDPTSGLQHRAPILTTDGERAQGLGGLSTRRSPIRFPLLLCASALLLSILLLLLLLLVQARVRGTSLSSPCPPRGGFI